MRAGRRSRSSRPSARTRRCEEGARATAGRRGADVIETSDAVFEALSPVQHPAASSRSSAVRTPAASRRCTATRCVLVVALVDVQDPGNVGALIRGRGGGACDRRRRGDATAPVAGRRCAAAWAARCDCRIAAETRDRPDQVLRAAGRPHRPRRAARRRRRAPSIAPAPSRWLLGGEGAGLPDDVVAAATSRHDPDAGGGRVAERRRAAALVSYEARGSGHDASSTTSAIHRRPVAPAPGTPLAERMRPRTLDEVVGQDDSSRPGGRCAKRSSATCCSRSSCGARPAPARRRWRA